MVTGVLGILKFEISSLIEMSEAIQQHINNTHILSSAAASLYHSKSCISLNGLRNNLPLIQLLADIILALLSF